MKISIFRPVYNEKYIKYSVLWHIYSFFVYFYWYYKCNLYYDTSYIIIYTLYINYLIEYGYILITTLP